MNWKTKKRRRLENIEEEVCRVIIRSSAGHSEGEEEYFREIDKKGKNRIKWQRKSKGR